MRWMESLEAQSAFNSSKMCFFAPLKGYNFVQQKEMYYHIQNSSLSIQVNENL